FGPGLALRALLGLPAATPGLSTPICVVEAGGRAFGLVADAVSDIHPLTAPGERLGGRPPARAAGGGPPPGAGARARPMTAGHDLRRFQTLLAEVSGLELPEARRADLQRAVSRALA